MISETSAKIFSTKKQCLSNNNFSFPVFKNWAGSCQGWVFFEVCTWGIDEGLLKSLHLVLNSLLAIYYLSFVCLWNLSCNYCVLGKCLRKILWWLVKYLGFYLFIFRNTFKEFCFICLPLLICLVWAHNGEWVTSSWRIWKGGHKGNNDGLDSI